MHVMFFVDFRREITEKGLKRTNKVENGKKNSSTSFWVRAAPKGWLKYTTDTLSLDGVSVVGSRVPDVFINFFDL